MKLNLGCGFNKPEGFIHVDMFEDCQPDIVHNLETFPYPFASDSVDEILFNHSLEHIGQQSSVFLKIMQEIYRVCRDDSIIRINVPHPRHDNFISDPTHVRIITPMTLMLFDFELNKLWKEKKAANSPLAIYLGVDFKLIHTSITVEEEYMHQLEMGQITNKDLNIFIKERNNIASEYRFTLKVIKKDLKKIFSKIYEDEIWGKSNDPSQLFYSGIGSHDKVIVSTYIQAVHEFLSTFVKKPNVVDLGCGDFLVGSKIRQLCDNYIACDIVPELIEFNKHKYKTLDVDFRVVDLTTNDLPSGDIVFVRQVLQHLSNEQILKAIPKLCTKYKYLVLTEHLPISHEFEHNLDKPAGFDIRTGIESGLVLTSPPFNLKARNERKLCEVLYGGIITTTLYQFVA